MDYKEYKALVDQIKIGKQLPDSIYVHNSSLSGIPEKLTTITIKIADLLKISDDAWNIVKFNKRDFKLSLLSYPTFESYAYPALDHSFTINLAKLSVREASYKESINPPILHRKETFVSDDYPLREEFCGITKEGESIGLYENTRTIGFKQSRRLEHGCQKFVKTTTIFSTKCTHYHNINKMNKSFWGCTLHSLSNNDRVHAGRGEQKRSGEKEMGYRSIIIFVNRILSLDQHLPFRSRLVFVRWCYLPYKY